MVRQGSVRLNASRKAINDLNVFPIPDGDTGDNMMMTISAGCGAQADAPLCDVAAAVSQGMLLGARGNSGVILSRIFAGIAKGLSGLESADIAQFSEAMRSGVAESYRAVSTPVEGTILTVLRESVEAAAGSDFEHYFETLVEEMRRSLDRTPDLLPVLKEACVVDSGGAGMLCIAEGMLDALKGIITYSGDGFHKEAPKVNLDDFGPDTKLEFGYCTEFLLRLQNDKTGGVDGFDESVIRNYLDSVGESVVCFRDGSIVKVHVHTMTPGDILSHVQRWGEFLTVKIENMTLQHSEVDIHDEFSAPKAAQEEPQAESFASIRKPCGIVAVVSGDGLEAAFHEAGVDVTVAGGQTMNPSAGSLVEAFSKVNAQTIFVLPNNSNIIMTALQAASLYEKSKVVVLPTKDPGTGYVVAASLDCSSHDVDAITGSAKEIIASVATGFISVATRDANMDGVEVRMGEKIAIGAGRIIASGNDRESLAVELARSLGAADHEAAIVFSGKEVSAQEAASLVERLQDEFPRTEFLLTEGRQPVYDYILTLC